MTPIVFRSEVYDDIKIAYDWYESQRRGLGEDFLLILEDSCAKISREPHGYQLIYKNIRRKLVNRFPYGIFFTLQDDGIIVVAIIHTKRNPTEWSSRE